MKEQEGTRQIERLALFAFLLNFCRTVMKGVLSLLSGSLAVNAGVMDPAVEYKNRSPVESNVFRARLQDGRAGTVLENSTTP